ncbi:MAG: recombinase family protein [Clostridia bacterium]|nr:recombinase family protein [Clostridia bacterium]
MARKSRFVNQAVITQNNSTTLQDSVWNCAVYLRLSVEDGDDVEANSIGNQKKICMSYIDTHHDINVFDIYMDHGYSGMNYNRPGFYDMYKAVQAGLVNCIIVKDISRFGRNYIETSNYLQKEFPDTGVRFISIGDNYDSLYPDSDVEGLLLPFKMILNDSYVKDISRKIRTSIAAKMQDGDYLPSSSSIPYGYIRNPDENTFSIDMETAPIVKRIFIMRSEKMSFNAIAKVLNEEKIPSPGKIRYLRHMTTSERYENAEWYRKTIQKITSDLVYTGCRIHGKYKRERLNTVKKHTNSEEWLVHENSHEAIISKELFRIVTNINQSELEHRAEFHHRESVEVDFHEIFRNKLYCGDCGSNMVAMKRNQRLTSQKKPELFYQCNRYQYSGKSKCCNHYIRQDIILKTLQTVFEQQLAVVANVEAAVAAFKVYMSNNTSDIQNKLQSLRVQRRNVEEKIERLLVDISDGLLDKEEYIYAKAKYQKQLDSLKSEEIMITQKIAKEKETMKDTLNWLDGMKHYRKNGKIDKESLDLLVKRILVYPKNKIVVELNYSDPYKNFMDLYIGDKKEA